MNELDDLKQHLISLQKEQVEINNAIEETLKRGDIDIDLIRLKKRRDDIALALLSAEVKSLRKQISNAESRRVQASEEWQALQPELVQASQKVQAARDAELDALEAHALIELKMLSLENERTELFEDLSSYRSALGVSIARIVGKEPDINGGKVNG